MAQSFGPSSVWLNTKSHVLRHANCDNFGAYFVTAVFGARDPQGSRLCHSHHPKKYLANNLWESLPGCSIFWQIYLINFTALPTSQSLVSTPSCPSIWTPTSSRRLEMSSAAPPSHRVRDWPRHWHQCPGTERYGFSWSNCSRACTIAIYPRWSRRKLYRRAQLELVG